MEENDVKEHIRKDATPALQHLLELAGTAQQVLPSVVRNLRRNTTTYVHRAGPEQGIWEWTLFPQYVRECPDPRTMPWKLLRGLSAAVLITSLPCRPKALINIKRSSARLSTDGTSVIVRSREKTDFGRGQTELVFYEAPEWRLSPKFYWDLLNGRAESLHAGDALYCSEDGVPYTSSDTICKAMTSLLQDEMHVKDWTAYSFRTSSISRMFRSGLNERQVNAFTGHSNNAHTALNFYYKLNKKTIGAALRVLPSDKMAISEEAAAFLASDDLDA
jgi:hypothetical protein